MKEGGKALQEICKGLQELEKTVQIWGPHFKKAIEIQREMIVAVGGKISSLLNKL